jgi:hypothetical protein
MISMCARLIYQQAQRELVHIAIFAIFLVLRNRLSRHFSNVKGSEEGRFKFVDKSSLLSR